VKLVTNKKVGASVANNSNKNSAVLAKEFGQSGRIGWELYSYLLGLLVTNNFVPLQ
jgi:hypothetical protein